MRTRLLIIVCIFLVVSALPGCTQTIEFKSEDGLQVTADLYLTADKNAPFIILFHQAGWSRGEYLEIAPRLNDMGYNCMAVDQRSGKEVNGVVNETAKRAVEQALSNNYPDALPDMYAAIKYVKNNYKSNKLIIWGSSYSSALVLKITGDKTDLVDAVLAFAPGEYFTNFGKADDWIQQSAKTIKVPAFITSAKKEHVYWKNIFEVIPCSKKQSFLPETKGNHGSRALWKQFDDHTDYWKAVITFLESI